MIPISVSVTFKLVDSKTGIAIDPDTIAVDGNEQEFAASSGNVTMQIPYGKDFNLTIQKQQYAVFNSTCSSVSLNNSSQALTPEQVVENETECKISWNHSTVKDLDSHLLIYNSAGTKLSEVYYNRKNYNDDNVTVALDRDDTGHDTGETITVTPKKSDGIDYKFVLVLHDYSNRSNHSSYKMS